MSAPITSENGTHNLFKTPRDGRPKVVILQGDNNDFEWSLEASTDGGINWTTMGNGCGDGIDTYTGCKPMQFWECADVDYRVKVTSMGSATSINVREN